MEASVGLNCRSNPHTLIMSASKTKRVVIIQEHMPHYRAKFFALLRQSLSSHDIELRLIHGIDSDPRMLSQSPDWADPVEITKIGPFSWHHLKNLCHGADLIIVPQEVKYLRLHLSYLMTRFSNCKFSYWGHGRNFQASDPKSVAERLKRFLSRHVDWWFAYNDLSARVVEGIGYPKDRITSVGNTVDIVSLSKLRDSLKESSLTATREELGLVSTNIAIYTGALYPAKRIQFLIESAILIRQQIPDFELIMIGDGPQRSLVSKAASEHSWIHDLGPKNDQEKVPYWAISKVLLMPGLVGLVIVDSFALGVPMVTTDYPAHSPEIDYLRDGENGLLVTCGDSVEAYANAVTGLLNDGDRLSALSEGARSSAAEHTLESMIRNFSDGVLKALSDNNPLQQQDPS